MFVLYPLVHVYDDIPLVILTGVIESPSFYCSRGRSRAVASFCAVVRGVGACIISCSLCSATVLCFRSIYTSCLICKL
jgi:hypothetical protein